MSLPPDVREFLDDYPRLANDTSRNDIFNFYSNKKPCKPDLLLIDQLHELWKTDYSKLEYKHGYIQWLFPLQELGMNYEAPPLQKHEIAAMKADPNVTARLERSYEIMLGFYGMVLVSKETGELRRADNWEERYRNLVRATHNYLRISRILKSLSELGLERFNAGFLLFVLMEQSANKQLSTQMIKNSMDRWWANCVRNEEERRWINETLRKVRTEDGFVFSEEAYQETMRRRRDTGSLKE